MPARIVRRTDYFGNIVDQFQIVRPHTTLSVTAESFVDVNGERPAPDTRDSPPWEDVSRRFNDAAALPEVSQFVYASPYAPLSREIDALARGSFPPDGLSWKARSI